MSQRDAGESGGMGITYVLTKEDCWRYQQFAVARRLRLPLVLFQALDAVYVGCWLLSGWLLSGWLLARHLWPLRFFVQAGLPGWPFWHFLFLMNERRILSFVAFTLVLAYLFFGAKFLALRRFASQTALFGRTTRILRLDALYTMVGGKKSFLPWERFEALVEDRHSLYFCLPKNQSVIIPKSAFGDHAAAVEFLRMAREGRRQALLNTDAGAAKRPWPGQTGEAVWPPPPTDRPAPAVTARIRIVATVPGEAPEEVRQAWTGLILPALCGPDGPLHRGAIKGVLSGQSQGTGEGYLVPVGEALEVLAQAHPEAAQWWRDNLVPSSTDHPLLFSAAVCEVVPG